MVKWTMINDLGGLVTVKVDLSKDPYALNVIMEFDHVIRVDDHGVHDHPEVYAPSLYDGELDQLPGDQWSLLTGYTGQYGYRGPIMHPSEFIGGGLARDILATPGLYVALVDYPLDGGEPDGWAVAYRES